MPSENTAEISRDMAKIRREQTSFEEQQHEVAVQLLQQDRVPGPCPGLPLTTQTLIPTVSLHPNSHLQLVMKLFSPASWPNYTRIHRNVVSS